LIVDCLEMLRDTRKRGVVALAAVLAGCVAASGAPARTPAPAPARLVVSLERERCFGACPAYKVEIDTDGAVRYEGRWHVCKDLAGDRLTADELTQLRAAIRRSGFATTPVHCCDCPVADSSLLTLTVADSGIPKTIVDAEFCEGAPTTIRELARTIDALVVVERWTCPEGERPQSQYYFED
jgi:hypothetical protein